MNNKVLQTKRKRCCRNVGGYSLLVAIIFILLFFWNVDYNQLYFPAKLQFAFNSQSVTPSWKSNKRGYVALMYSGTARSFSANFESHIVNLMAGCPYTVHLFLHTYINDNRYPDHLINSSDANYLSVNSTLEYFEGYINLDNERVLFHDIVKANVFEYLPLETLREMYNNTYDISQKRFPGHPPIPGIYYMWHSQRRCEELRQKYMNANRIDYKWVFRMRHDAVYYTNWWQQAFNVDVYDPLNSLHKNITHDVSSDWGIRYTRLYDMVYEPKLRMNNTLYVPRGWSWGGYNDQYAAMSSINANHYFTRILHVDRMLREGKVHPETSIRLVARWNHILMNNVDGTICYEIVRSSWEEKQPSHSESQRKQSCKYKGSGKTDCNILCPKFEKINKALGDKFAHGNQVPSLLIHHLSHINNNTVQIDLDASSFYYFYRYANLKDMNNVCLLNTRPKDQRNIYAIQKLPFVLRTSNRTKIQMYNKHLTCGPSVDIVN